MNSDLHDQNEIRIDKGGDRVDAFRNAHDWRVGQINIVNGTSSVWRRSLADLLDPLLDASYTRNRKRSPPNSICFKGTRESVIEKVMAWINSCPLPHSCHVMWIYGFAGCGKSAIAQVISERIAGQGHLVASFFFFRGSGTRSTVEKFATTVASQLAAAVPEIAPFIQAAIDSNPGLVSLNTAEIGAQFEHLVYHPINMVGQERLTPYLLSGPLLIILDGVDECEDRADIADFIEHMIEYFNNNPSTPLRFLITSRVEIHLHQRLHSSNQVELLDLVKHTFDKDIAAALDVAIEKEKSQRIMMCDPSWPSPSDRRSLVQHIGRSYIFMTTIIKLLFDPEHYDGLPPMDRLPLILATSPDFDALYRSILSPWEKLPHFHDIMSTVALAAIPLSIVQISEILEIRTVDVVSVLTKLHAIIQVPGDDCTPVTLWHTSLHDFFSSARRAGSLFASPAHHLRIALRCALLSMNSPALRFGWYTHDFGNWHLLKSVGKAKFHHCARCTSKLDKVAEVLHDLRQILNQPTFEGQTALQAATTTKNWTLVKCLAKANANVNICLKDGQTPLHNACTSGEVEGVRILLKYHADSMAKNQNGDTPLHCACFWGHIKVAKVLLENNADPSTKNQNGETPLHHACFQGHLELTRLLLQHDAIPSIQDHSGSTPLWCACSGTHIEVVRLLLEHGADFSKKGRFGDTPFHLASSQGHVEMVRLFLNCNADPSIRGSHKQTPLHDACSRGHVEAARLLLDHNADSSMQDKDGKTPLHHACLQRGVRVLKLLLDHNADSSIQDCDGNTPLHCACLLGKVELAELLLSYSADPFILNKQGQTVLQVIKNPNQWIPHSNKAEVLLMLAQRGIQN